ncbi:MAG: winged helix-turn-helix domain-containing protein [Sedimenticola sp.]
MCSQTSKPSPCISQGNFVGRTDLLDKLASTLEPQGARVVHVSGIAGIGKSTLIEMFSDRAHKRGGQVIRLECRNIEPTENGFIQALANALRSPADCIENISTLLGEPGTPVVLALDTYEVLLLMDTWLRQVFVPLLPDNVSLHLYSRERPLPAWQTDAQMQGRFSAYRLEPLPEDDTHRLLGQLDVPPEAIARVGRFAHGHPLALKLAASAYQARPDINLKDENLQQVLQALTRMFLEDVSDQSIQSALEGISVARRTTVSLLRALAPDIDPDAVYVRLSNLPYIDINSDGLMIHDVVREAIANTLRARDPVAFLDYRRKVWQQLVSEVKSAGSSELWRYTADMLYLIENPVVREAFFPSGTSGLTVEPASGKDADAVHRIITANEGPDAVKLLTRWWQQMPHAFSIIRRADGSITGFYCKFQPGETASDWLKGDPVTATWLDHLDESPLLPGETALFCRRWLSHDEGETPSDEQAAAWLDLKRTYMEMRPNLRRIYLTICDLPAYAPVAQRLGFQVLSGDEVELDDRIYHSAVLDFGPESVDGWLSTLAASELGIEQSPSLLDISSRELVINNRRVPLTPLEFGVFDHLVSHKGKAVPRLELLEHVWGTSYQGGSNVVDSVIRGLRRKLATKAKCIETVTGVGYRFRQ